MNHEQVLRADRKIEPSPDTCLATATANSKFDRTPVFINNDYCSHVGNLFIMAHVFCGQIHPEW